MEGLRGLQARDMYGMGLESPMSNVLGAIGSSTAHLVSLREPWQARRI